MVRLTVAWAIMLLASITLPIQTNAGSMAHSVSSQCELPPGWNKVAQRKPKYIVFGELHGTRQSPEFVGNIVCALAARRKPVLLAVELDSSVDAEIQQAWKLPPDQFSTALAKNGWRGRTDGVASEAMFAMLVRLHRLSQAGLPIKVTAFNGFRDVAQASKFRSLSGQGPHEAAQAENIAAAASAGRYANVIVLVGGLHARKATVDWNGANFEPMARRLGTYGKVVSLEMRYAGGSAWNCQLKPDVKPVPGQPIRSDDIVCSNRDTKGYPDLGSKQFVRLGQSNKVSSPSRFDGIFWVGTIEGSVPAVQ